MVVSVARACRSIGALFGAWIAAAPVHALTIELKDVAPDRIERQRRAAEGALPLAGTPNLSSLMPRLREKGVTLASPVLIRVFKAESELEVWKLRDGAFQLFAAYPVCQWSGTVGPKVKMGDKQAPEGFYTLTAAQLHHIGRWPKSFNLGFPNAYDQSLGRTGFSILIHGGCSSVGCFAMTNAVMDELHLLATAASAAGETFIPVHVYPFRMTAQNMAAHAESPWAAFWANLKEGYDAFERTHRAPRVSACGPRYSFEEGDRASPAGGPLTVCSGHYAMIKDQNQWLDSVPPPQSREPLQMAQARAASIAQAAGQMLAMTPPSKLGGPVPAGQEPRKQARAVCPGWISSCRRLNASQTKVAALRAALMSRATAKRSALAARPHG